jgi:hypothetical protein
MDTITDFAGRKVKSGKATGAIECSLRLRASRYLADSVRNRRLIDGAASRGGAQLAREFTDYQPC